MQRLISKINPLFLPGIRWMERLRLRGKMLVISAAFLVPASVIVHDWNKNVAAKILGISLKTLYTKIRQFDLTKD